MNPTLSSAFRRVVVSLWFVALGCSVASVGVSVAAEADRPSSGSAAAANGGGTRLPEGGGEPGRAYAAFIDAVYRKDYAQLCRLMASDSAELDQCLGRKEEIGDAFFGLLTQPQSHKVLGGVVNGDEARLDVACTFASAPPSTAFVVMEQRKGKWVFSTIGGSGSATVSATVSAEADLAKASAEGGGSSGVVVPAEPSPEMATLTSTFVPGEKAIFYDDFTDMTADSPPPHFKVRGSGVELMAAGDVRQLTVRQKSSLLPNLASLPRNFTFEAELNVDVSNRAILYFLLLDKGKEAFVITTTAGPKESEQTVAVKVPKYEELGRKRFKVDWSKPVKVALWVQDGRVRTYVDGEKLIDVNQVTLPAASTVELSHGFAGANQSIGYRSVRFAEAAPDFSQVIASSGRYVTYGIHFDTGSARIQPDSAPVLQLIAKGLEADPGLRLTIEGHTDSVGGADANLDLSRRRAEAVKEVLVSQFKVDAARLATEGLGAAQPVAPNDTPQGRAQNRRVELVKR